MNAMILRRIATIVPGSSPLDFTNVPDPEPGEGEVLIQSRRDVEVYPLTDANRALVDLKFLPVRAPKVLIIAE